MNQIQSFLIASCLSISNFACSVSWAQSKTILPSTTPSTIEAVSFEGAVVDAATRRPIAGATVLARNQAAVVSGEQRVGADGMFRINLGPRQSYVVTISAAGYHSLDEQLTYTSVHVSRLSKTIGLHRIGTNSPARQNTTIAEPRTAPNSTSSVATTALPEVTVMARSSPLSVDQPETGPRVTPPKTLDAKVVFTPPLVVAVPGKITQLRAVQFVQSRAELLPDAQPALEQLAAFLKNNPTAEIELAGHTDNQGDFDENVRLSKQRVEVVKGYLVTNGIAAGRITARGYGPTRPIGSNNAESTRQLNRRVEMTILKQ